MVRVGQGIDAHRLTPRGTVRLGGIPVDSTRGVSATSDGDVVAHAVADALLGATALGDLGELFPSSDPRWRDADSMELLTDVVRRVLATGHRPTGVDVTVVAETVRVAPHRDAVRGALAQVLGLEVGVVSVKATTTDGLGWLGSDQGIVAVAVVTVIPGDTG